MTEARSEKQNNAVPNYASKRFETDARSLFVGNLQAETKYDVTITEGDEQTCQNSRKRKFRTVEAKCFKQCAFRKLNESTIKYESQLRIIPLPGKKHVVVWDPYDPFDYNDTTFDYVVNVLGEPFLYHLSSHLVPDGRHYIVINDLNNSKSYTINLQVFSSSHGGRPYASQHLLVHPYEDLVGSGNLQSPVTMNSVWRATTMDTVVHKSHVNSSNMEIDNGHIDDTDLVLVTTAYSFDDFLEDDYDANNREAPRVFEIQAIETMEYSDKEVMCFAVGDPYPEITLLNISSNQVLGEEDTNVNRTVFTIDRKYVGSSGLVDGRVYMGIRAFVTFKNLSVWDTGQYACVAENIAGEGNSTFQLHVLPLAPKPVQNVSISTPTPFDIIVAWSPAEARSRDHPGFILGYHVTVLDEFNVVLRVVNTSNTTASIKDMHPETLYHIQVSAYHKYDEGQPTYDEIEMPAIPPLGQPQNITAVTINNSTIHVSWKAPHEVLEQRVRLRGYTFQYREAGGFATEEMILKKQFTNVSMIGLQADCRYEARVTAMSEDAQLSSTDWLSVNTSRESFMNESVEPPPPHNVYLNLQGGDIIVSWLPPYPQDNILIRGYVIDVFYDKTKLLTMEVGYKESSVIIYDVEMGVLYRVSVQAKNRAGLSLRQTEELRIPREYVTQYPVETFRGRALTSTMVELSWTPPAKGVFSRFHLSYTLDDEEKPMMPGGGILPASVRNFTVRPLQPYTGYIFFITPYLKDIAGVRSNTTVTTLTDKPSAPPENASLTVINSTTILVQCNPPRIGKNGPILHYKISYRQPQFVDSFTVPAETNENLNYFITGLIPDTVYEIRVQAMTVNGSGPWSPWLQERTAKREPILPKIPRNMTVTSTKTSITITWQPPDQGLSEITGFIVGKGRFIPEVFRTSLANDKRAYTFRDLDSKSVYIVSIRSFNDFGESEALFDLVSTA